MVETGTINKIDRMFVLLVNESDDSLTVEIIQTSTDERKTICSEIANFRSEIDFAIEPRLHRVLV